MMTIMTKWRTVAIACVLFGTTACARTSDLHSLTTPTATPAATASTSTPEPTASAARTPSSHAGRVAVVVMENKEYDTVAGNAQAPYLNGLARTSALAMSFYAISHPSLPNYLALVGGDTFGINSDCTDCHVNTHNLVDQLEGAHVSWKAYMEAMPRRCFTGGSSGRYAKKHNPFVYFDDAVSDPGRCAKVVPLSELTNDEQHGLPDFVWITPDLCNDTHDCSVRTGDTFLSRLLPPLISSLGPRGVVVVTYDEGASGRGCCADAHGGRVFTVVAGPGARPGRYSQPLDHYSLLRAIEDRFGLSHLGRAATAPSMDALLNG
jgi:hypothetical protein